MTKINQEEYEVLKNLDDKWKWIARDEDRGLYAFTEKPVRNYGHSPYWWDKDGWDVEPYSTLELVDETHLFLFIQWEDEEPYNIQELIDEYLDDEYGYFNMKLSREFEEFIKKESEKREMKKVVNLSVSFDRGLETYPKMSIDEAIETLTDYGTKYAVVEKPVIPKEVGERIEREINQISLYRSLNYAYNYEGVGEDERRIDRWIVENTEEYAQAWLNGFTVEKHPILLAKIKGWEQFVDFVGAIYWGTDDETDRLTFVDRDQALAITKKDWEQLGITEKNADFIKED